MAIQHVRDPSLIEVTDKKFVANLSVPSPPDSPTERDLLSVTNLPDTSSPVSLQEETQQGRKAAQRAWRLLNELSQTEVGNKVVEALTYSYLSHFKEPKDAQRSSAPSSVGHRRAVAATSPLVPIVVTEASDMDETYV